jgi:hypothetical protein
MYSIFTFEKLSAAWNKNAASLLVFFFYDVEITATGGFVQIPVCTEWFRSVTLRSNNCVMGEWFCTAEWFRPNVLIEWFRSHLPVETYAIHG